MDVERIIDDIEQLQEMFEAPDTRPLSASDIAAANRSHDEMLAHSPWFRLWQRYGVCCRHESPVLKLRGIGELELRTKMKAALYEKQGAAQVVQLPEGVPLERGACLGIPGITAHRAVHVAGSVVGQTVLVQGGAGSVGACAVQLAHQAGARVIATCRTESDKGIASRAPVGG